MQKQSSRQIPYLYRPYDFPSHFPVLAFLGNDWRVEASQPNFLHFHNALEIGHCLSGKGVLYYGHSEQFSYDTGDYSIVFPNVPHISTVPQKPAAWEYIYIDPRQLLETATSYDNQLWQFFYMLQYIPPIIKGADSSLLHYYISRIFQEFHEKEPLYQNAILGLLLSLFAELNRMTMQTEGSEVSRQEGAHTDICNALSYIRNALSYIYQHYQEPISIRDLSQYCCISESHLRRLFHNIVGVSPLEYIQHYRIQQACHFLHLNQEPVNLIARKVGYTSLSSFNRQFQQYMHISPTAWQKEHSLVPDNHEVLSYHESDTRHIFKI